MYRTRNVNTCCSRIINELDKSSDPHTSSGDKCAGLLRRQGLRPKYKAIVAIESSCCGSHIEHKIEVAI